MNKPTEWYQDQFKPFQKSLDAIVLPLLEIDAIEDDVLFLELKWASYVVNCELRKRMDNKNC